MDTADRLSLAEVYHFLVSGESKSVVEQVGVVGGISHGVCYLFRLELTDPGPSDSRGSVLFRSSVSDRRVIARYTKG